MSTWTKVRDAVENFFTGTVWSFVKPFVTALETEGGPILITAAETAVTVGMGVAGDGAIKMAAALASFEAEVVAKGLPFIESQGRALIEVALQAAKGALAAA